MTLTTLPPVLESAVEKAALMALNMKREQNGFPQQDTLDNMREADKAEWLNDTALTALAFLNALLADGKAREGTTEAYDGRRATEGHTGFYKVPAIIISLEPLP